MRVAGGQHAPVNVFKDADIVGIGGTEHKVTERVGRDCALSSHKACWVLYLWLTNQIPNKQVKAKQHNSVIEFKVQGILVLGVWKDIEEWRVVESWQCSDLPAKLLAAPQRGRPLGVADLANQKPPGYNRQPIWLAAFENIKCSREALVMTS